jgi:hypothetical protein
MFVTPSDVIKYKDKYLLFYLYHKKPLDIDMLQKELDMNIFMPKTDHIDHRYWCLIKSKVNNKFLFAESKDGEPTNKVPEIRYFNPNSPKDSASYYAGIVDMSIGAINIFANTDKKSALPRFHKLFMDISISNKSESVFHIGISDKYGGFMIKNEQENALLYLKDVYNADEESPGIYSIKPKSEATFSLETNERPIVFPQEHIWNYYREFYELFHNSIYYIPKAPPHTDKAIWSKAFKAFYPWTAYYKYIINGKGYFVFWDGEIQENDTSPTSDK